MAIPNAPVALPEPIDLVSSEGEVEPPGKRRRRGNQRQDNRVIACMDIYNKACKCKKDYPYCLANIIPSPGGHRKKGLWQKESATLLSLGPDPARLVRQVGSIIAILLAVA